MLGIGPNASGARRTARRRVDPAEISALPGMWSWHTVSEGAMVLDGSGNIETLLDRSGNGRHFGNAPSAQRPSVIADAILGKAAARFSGAQGLTYLADHPTGAYTNLFVFRSPASAAVQTIFGQTTTSNDNHRIYLDPTTLALRHQVQNAALVAGDNNASAGAVSADIFHVAIAAFDGAAGTVKSKRDAVAPTVLTRAGLSAIRNQTNYLGCGNLPAGVPSSVFRGDLAAIVILSTDVLAAAQSPVLATLRDYLALDFGLAA
ncbi:hypothetical protein [Roseomonas sp. USHLN139]|uniref:hypothetical protein n=1 Tax=Roseomonas sp. USHLN139 TaxID=3081298 RepID=UPI003B014197